MLYLAGASKLIMFLLVLKATILLYTTVNIMQQETKAWNMKFKNVFSNKNLLKYIMEKIQVASIEHYSSQCFSL